MRSVEEKKQIFTGKSFKESMCVKGIHIHSVGTISDVTKHCPTGTFIDLKSNELILPAFADSHVHLFEGGISLSECDLSEVESLEDFVTTIKAYMQEHEKKEWIFCRNWLDEKFDVFPDIDTMNSISNTKHLFVERWDHHSILVNQKIMDAANITVETKYEGGVIGVKDRKLTGYIYEKAIELVDQIAPLPDYELALETAMAYLNSFGITQVTSMGRGFNYEMNKKEIEVLKKFREEDKLTVRVYQAVNLLQLDYILDYIEKEGKGDDLFKVGLVKDFYDGSLGSKTAYQFVAYKDDPTDFGIKIWEDEEKLFEYIEKAVKSEMQVTIHAIGSRANYEVLKMYARLEDKKRIRIEHAQQIRDEDLKLFKEYSVYPSMNPSHIAVDHDLAEKTIPPETRHEIHREKEVLETITTGFSSDWPVRRPNPFEGIYYLMKYKDMELTDALKGYTKNNAFISFYDNKLGFIEVGFYADFIVLDRNIFEAGVEVASTKIEKTFCNGDVVYSRES